MEPKGVSNRNGGLAWVKARARDGVVYFADDDNTYDIRLFEEVCVCVCVCVLLLLFTV